MKEVKDPEIKLFGKKICLMDNGDILHAGEEFSGDDSKVNGCELLSEVEESGIGTENEDERIGFTEENCKSLPEENKQDVVVEESQNIDAASVCEDSPDSTSMDDGENDQGDTNTDNSQQKALKKPDKILPCPRCNSMDTKFCYYNNYNVNQPRHFCKSCQRYWTAGGTMRNVPVGAGRRKNKNFPSNSHSITISEALQAVQMDAPNGFHHPNFRPNGSILCFGQELPLCDPVSSALNMTNKNTVNGGSNGFYKLDPVTSVCGKGVGNGTNSSSLKVHQGANNGQQEPVLQQMNGFSPPVPYLPSVPWPYPWNPAVPMQAFCPPGYHIPIYPTPLWNCNMNGPWSFPWLLPNSSSTLGKHSRNGEVVRSQESEGGEPQEPKCSEGSVLVPKTLRIDDPEEAAKSSIWTTLGITYDSKSNKGGLFKAFEQKTSEKKCPPSASPAFQVNPAALSRSLIFQERA